MKKLLSTVIFVWAFSTAILAQEDNKPHWKKCSTEEKVEKMTQRMTEELSLSNTQKESIRAINLKYISQLDELKAKELPREERHKEIKPIRKAMSEEYKAVLTAQQWETLQANRQERRRHRSHKGERCQHKKKQADCEQK